MPGGPARIGVPEAVREFSCMGARMRIVVGQPLAEDTPAAEAAAQDCERFLHELDACLSRFRPESELTALNSDPRPQVEVSPLLAAAVGAGLWAARRTAGLLDPTLAPAMRAAGYDRTFEELESISLWEAMAGAPQARLAAPDPSSRWREIVVDQDRGTVSRPPGLEIDTGGIGKGLAADAVAVRLEGYARFAVDCAGDIRVGGPSAAEHPYRVDVANPGGGEPVATLAIGAGGVATSGIDSRVWRLPDGRVSHHLLDPATGEPAWTGIVTATALAPTALEAETLAKAALLSGPKRAREVLTEHGGVIVRDDGSAERIGPLPLAQ